MSATPPAARANKKPHRKLITEELKQKARFWTEAIGPRAAARKLNLSEDTVCKWAWLEHWPSPKVFERGVKDYALRRAEKQMVSIVHDARDAVIAEHGSDARLLMSSSSLKAAAAFAQMPGEELTKKDPSIAHLNNARTLDVVHGWQAERAKAPVVQVANIVMPTEEERERERKTDEALDAIAARLRELSAQNPQT